VPGFQGENGGRVLPAVPGNIPGEEGHCWIATDFPLGLSLNHGVRVGLWDVGWIELKLKGEIYERKHKFNSYAGFYESFFR
jgi:hypothetical protein